MKLIFTIFNNVVCKLYYLSHNILKFIFLSPVYIYRYSFSLFMGRTCRYFPSCSEYMIEAVDKHGIWVGWWMGFFRVCRCHPWGGEGLDPVPKKITTKYKWYKPWSFKD